jgi:NADPH-dependent ferric siderophore reductase
MTVQAPEIPAYRVFDVQVARVARLSPSFLRVTFTGASLDECAPNGLDQRIKVVLPLPGRGLADCPRGADWYGEWRALPEDRRNPIRTYTVRATRPRLREIDVDFVLHGSTGPASAWAERAAVGDEVALVAPNARFPGPTGGFAWRPPTAATRLLLAGDETAVPAVCAIVESLPPGRPVRVLLEVPSPADVLPLPAPEGVEITWLPRRTPDRAVPAPHGSLLVAAVPTATRERPGAPARPVAPSGDDATALDEVPWNVPDDADPQQSPALYAWLAGEAGMVRQLRRHLVQETGTHRSVVAFMGYWRTGRRSD